MADKYSSAIRPRGLWRFFNWLPVILFRVGLAGLVGDHFLLLEYKAAKRGRIRRIIAEIIRHDPSVGVFYVVSAFGAGSKWVKDIKVNPDVRIYKAASSHAAISAVLSRDRSAAEILDFAKRNPRSMKSLVRSLLGVEPGEEKEDLLELASNLQVVRLHVINSDPGKRR